MSTSGERTTPGAISARGATGVGVAALVAAASGYAVLLVAANGLTPRANADFLSFWSLLFFLFGVLGGLQSEVTRSVRVERTAVPQDPADRQRTPRVLPMGLLIGAALGCLVALTSPLWAASVLGADPYAEVWLVAAAVVAFAGHSTVVGALAGRGMWTDVARVVGAEAMVRLLLALALTAVGAGTVGLPVAAAAGAGTWLLLTVLGPVRDAARQRADSTARPFVVASGLAMVGAASSAALVVGFPVLLRLTTPASAYDLAAPLLLAVTLTRAPLLIPLNAYQGVVITHVLSHRDRGALTLVRPAVVVVAVGVVGALAAALAGPWLMTALLGADYRVEPLVLAGLTLGAAGLALLTLTGATVLALGRHHLYSVGWLIATACSAVALLSGAGSVEARVIVSLLVGPVVGVAVHLLGLRRTLPARR